MARPRRVLPKATATNACVKPDAMTCGSAAGKRPRSGHRLKQLRVRVFVEQRAGALLPTLHDELVQRRIDGNRVLPGEAGEAEARLRLAGRAHHAGDIEIADGIRAEVLADL